MADDNVVFMPSTGARQKVGDTLDSVRAQDFDEIVVLGFKGGKTYLYHSKLTSTLTIVGSLESVKHRLLEKRDIP